MKNILFICTGNTCRSPMTQYLFEDALKKTENIDSNAIKLRSAGLCAQDGMPASPEAIEVMLEEGLDITAHRSTRVNGGMVEDADIIITMTNSQKNELSKRFPYKKDKIFTIGEMAGHEDFELSDPFGQGLAEYRKASRQIKNLVNTIIERLAG